MAKKVTSRGSASLPAETTEEGLETEAIEGEIAGPDLLEEGPDLPEEIGPDPLEIGEIGDVIDLQGEETMTQDLIPGARGMEEEATEMRTEEIEEAHTETGGIDLPQGEEMVRGIEIKREIDLIPTDKGTDPRKEVTTPLKALSNRDATNPEKPTTPPRSMALMTT